MLLDYVLFLVYITLYSYVFLVRLIETRKPYAPVGACEARDKKTVSPQVSLSVFSLVPDLLFDCSRVLEYDCFAV